MHLSVHVDQISGHVTEVALKNNTRHSMPFSWHSVPAERLHRSAFFKATRYAASCTEKRTAPAQPHPQTRHGHTELTPLTTSATYLQLRNHNGPRTSLLASSLPLLGSTSQSHLGIRATPHAPVSAHTHGHTAHLPAHRSLYADDFKDTSPIHAGTTAIPSKIPECHTQGS